jgi:tRNA pseudouridine55 synthase
VNHPASQGLTLDAARRPPSGVLLIDKTTGVSSQWAVTRVKRLIGAVKAGHTGTLDPLASGLLPVCLGEATKFAHLLLDADKAYQATIRLGVTTTTGDREGETVAVSPVAVDRTQMEGVLARFVGEIDQVPPMFSAIKHHGRPLYRLAREGITLPRLARRIRIRSLDVLELDRDLLRINLTCGKGTYVRVLAEDIGLALGCGASLDGLQRTAVGNFTLGASTTMEVLEGLTYSEREQRLLAVDSPVETLPRIDVDSIQARYLIHGRSFQSEHGTGIGLVRLYDASSGRFLGVGARTSSSEIVPRRLMSGLHEAMNA